MNIFEKFKDLDIDVSYLTIKKEHTKKKIEFITEYVKTWGMISAQRDEVKTINFIDCMCNAGVYHDGDLCTAAEVIIVFLELAKKFPNKKFRLFCNDYDKSKILILHRVLNELKGKEVSNLRVFISNKDVNIYLDELSCNPVVEGMNIFGYSSSTVLYVDPFDFGTVEIPKITLLLKSYYFELIYNFFVSDFRRNSKKDLGRIQKCLGGKKVNGINELIFFIKNEFRVGFIKYLFSYQFRITTNVELYQIIFATPNKRGLEVLKDSLWKVFNGVQYHRNRQDLSQISFFTPQDEKDLSLQVCASIAQKILVEKYEGCEISFSDIELYLIENTMITENQIIKSVLKPLIASGTVIKKGEVSGRNFKNDKYIIKQRLQ